MNEDLRLLDNLPCGVCTIRNDEMLSLVDANTFYFHMLGFEDTHFLQASTQSETNFSCFAVYPSDLPAVKAALKTPQTSFEFEARLIGNNDAIVWVLASCTLVPERLQPDPEIAIDQTLQKKLITCVLVDITARKQMEETLRSSEEEKRLVLQHTNKHIFRYELATRNIVLSPDTAEQPDMPPCTTDLPYSVIEAGYIATESVPEYIRFYDAMNQGRKQGDCVVRARSNTGYFSWYRYNFSTVFDEQGDAQYAIVSYEDISDLREKELAYEKWYQYNETQRQGCLAYYECNLSKDLFDRIEGPMGALIPQPIRVSFTAVNRFVAERFVYPEDQLKFINTLSRDALLAQFYAGKREIQLEHRRISQQGVTFWAFTHIQLLSDPYSDDVKGFVLIKNIDKQKNEKLKLQELSQLDALTGLLNRGTTVDQISVLLENSDETNHHVFVMLDIDHFKWLNDSLGHQFGDTVLAEVARDLKSILRTDDIIGRLGGDEFVIFLKNMGTGNVLKEKAASLCKLLSKRFGQNTTISGSLGISVYAKDGTTFSELYRKADCALYEAKKRGRNQYVFYQPHMLSSDWKPYNDTPIDELSARISQGIGSAFSTNSALNNAKIDFIEVNSPKGAEDNFTEISSPNATEDDFTYANATPATGIGMATPLPVAAPQQTKNVPSLPSTKHTPSSFDDTEAFNAVARLKYYTIALRNTYDELFELNLTSDSYRIVNHVPHKYVIPPETGMLSTMILDVASNMIHPDDRTRFLDFCCLDVIRKKFKDGQECISGDFRKLHEQGGYMWATLMFVPMSDVGGDAIILCFITDIDKKKNAAAIALENTMLLQQQMDDERYRIIVEQTGTIVLEYNAVTDSFYMSPSAKQFTFAQNEGQKKTPHFLKTKDVHPKDITLVKKAYHSLKQHGDKAETVIRLRQIDGNYLWCRLTLRNLSTADGILKRCIMTINDVDAAVKDRKSLEYRAEYDDLTGSFNFSKYKIEVKRLLKKRGENKYSLWYCDLRNFKFVNDIYGYDFGDRVLQYWAKIISDGMREGETFSRIIADHFTVLRRYENHAELEQRFRRSAELLANYTELIGKKFRLEIVAGIYCIESQKDVLSLEDMIDRANIAQKAARLMRGSHVVVYSEEMRHRILYEKSIEADMHSALTKNEFEVYLQPIIDIQNNDVLTSAEALARWNRPGTGLVGPDEFIPLFEKNGFIVELDAFIFEQVCTYLHDRMTQQQRLLKISVNVSRISVFQSDFCTRYIGIKQRYAIPDGLLNLECTETTVVENATLLNEIMTTMRNHGFLLSLDDFGAGYSSLNMLKNVTVDILKLDMVFFRNNVQIQRDEAILSSIITMAKALNMQVVAEGVEAQEQLNCLRALGCHMVQGYLFGKPMPAQAFGRQFLKEEQD